MLEMETSCVLMNGTPDIFFRFMPGQTTIEHIYLEGVSVTHGSPGSRTHIWTSNFRVGLVVLVRIAIILLLHFLWKWERVTSVLNQLQMITFGRVMPVPQMIPAVPFTILCSSVCYFLYTYDRQD